MLGVFINLLYTHTMPNIYYCSTCMLLYPHLMAKHWLRVGRKSRFFPDLRHEPCLHGAVKVWWRALRHTFDVSVVVVSPTNNNNKKSKVKKYDWIEAWQPTNIDDDTPKERCTDEQVKNAPPPSTTTTTDTSKVWRRALQSCWECSSTCYTPIQCQTSTIAAPACCYTPT